ncbi:MAG: hypothetical protein CM1200mP29_07880 [Verrucomicrobiota bacterium]|nr:MAG: hypothetical protein CM1200mP29_07880 [Verrucomicrobiota bacterium]
MNPGLLEEVKLAKASELVTDQFPGLTKDSLEALTEAKRLASGMQPGDYGDRVLPHFIANQMPVGLAGLLIAALFAAAMSSIDTSLNSSSTIALQDFYRRWFRPDADEAQSLFFLRVMTVVWGGIGTGVALAMMGVQSILDAGGRLAACLPAACWGCSCWVSSVAVPKRRGSRRRDNWPAGDPVDDLFRRRWRATSGGCVVRSTRT